MKKLPVIVSAILLLTCILAAPINAATFTPVGDTYESSDPNRDFNPDDIMVWFEDGTACSQNPSLDTNSNDLPENNLSNIAGKWYEFVYCDIGSTPEMFPPEVAGKIALIKRGESTFTVKTENAKNAGAVGALICNNFPDGELVDDDGTILIYNDVTMAIEYPTIPCGSISSDIGAKLIEQRTGKVFIGTLAQYQASIAEMKAAEEAAAAEASTATTTAPQTADVSSVIVMAAVVSLAGVVIARKKR